MEEPTWSILRSESWLERECNHKEWECDPIDSQGLREKFSGDRQEEKHCLYVGATVANPEGVSGGDIAQCYPQSSTPQVTATTKRNIHSEFTKTQAPLEGE